MGFIENPYVPNGKVDNPNIVVPHGQENMYVRAADFNAVCNDLLDLRTHAINGYTGLSERASAPTGSVFGLSSTNLWAKTDGTLIFTRSAVDNVIVAIPATTKGDLAVFNGTAWQRLGSSLVNNEVLTVDTSTATGLKWAASGGGGGGTLATSYAAGTVAADQTMLIQSGDGGPAIFKANGAATGVLFKAQTSTGADLLSISDNGSQTYVSGQADGGGSVAHVFDTITAWSTGKLFSFRTNGVEKLYLSSFNGSMLFGTDGAALYGADSNSRIQFTTGVTTVQSGIGAVTLQSGISNSASAVAHIFDTSNTMSTSGAKAFSFRSGGTEWGFWGITSSGRQLIVTGDTMGLEVRNISSPTTSAGIRLAANQNGSTGRAWTLAATGQSHSLGAGFFVLRDEGAGADRLIFDTTGNIRPATSSSVNLGGSSNAWGNVFTVAVTQPASQVFALQGAQASGAASTTFEARATVNITTTGHKLWAWMNNTSTAVAYVEKTASGWSVSTASGTDFTSTKNSLGTTTGSTFIAQNTTAATLGNQQVSPAVAFEGRGWSTGSSVSRTTGMRLFNLPTQSTEPIPSLVFQLQPGNGSYTTIGSISSWSSTTGFKVASASGNTYLSLDGPVTGFQYVIGGSSVSFHDSTAFYPNVDNVLTLGKAANTFQSVYANQLRGAAALNMLIQSTLDLSVDVGQVFSAVASTIDFTANGPVSLVADTQLTLQCSSGPTLITGTEIGFFGGGPAPQQIALGTTTGFTAGSGTPVNDDSTFTGDIGSSAYTIGDIVLALKSYGLLAS